MSRRRRIAVWALVVGATLIALVSVMTVWVQRQLLDNGSWKSASEQIIQDPQVQSALSVYLVNQLYQNVDVAAALQERLPPTLAPLADPLAAALKQPATNAVGLMLTRPRVQQLWIDASTRAHQRLLNVLENKTGYGIATGNGVVTLDLSQLVAQLGSEIGLPADVLAKVPPDAGQITVMKSSQLSLAQTSVAAVKALSVWLVILVLLMYALAVYLAEGSRRTILRGVGWAFVLVGVLALIVRKFAGEYVTGALATDTYRTTMHHVWLIATSALGDLGWALVFYGVITLVGVTLAGPTRAAQATRRLLAPVLNERQGVAWSVAGFLFLLLVLWGPTHALRTWWGILLIGALLAAGLAALRRQTLVEFPAGTSAGIGVPQMLRGRTKDPAAEISRLTALHDAGSLTDEEFERAKELALT